MTEASGDQVVNLSKGAKIVGGTGASFLGAFLTAVYLKLGAIEEQVVDLKIHADRANRLETRIALIEARHYSERLAVLEETVRRMDNGDD